MKQKPKFAHLHTAEVRRKISESLKGNTNGRHTRGIKKPGSAKGGLQNLAKAIPARLASPLGGPFETCAWATEYDLVAPDGTHYRGRNLKLFIREHPELFHSADVAAKSKGPYPDTNANRRLRALLSEDHRLSWKGWTKPTNPK